MRVVWTTSAVQDLDCELEYIRQNNPHAASRLVDRVLKAERTLAEYPQSGRLDETSKVRGY